MNEETVRIYCISRVTLALVWRMASILAIDTQAGVIVEDRDCLLLQYFQMVRRSLIDRYQLPYLRAVYLFVKVSKLPEGS